MMVESCLLECKNNKGSEYLMKENKRKQENKKHLTRLGTTWGGVHVDLDLIPKKALAISAGLAEDISFDLDLINRKECFVVGVDPTRLSRRTVRRTFYWSFRHGKGEHFSKRNHFRLLQKAVLGKTDLTVYLGGPARTFLSPTGEKANTISLEDLVSMYAGAALLKLDIEGAEFPALENLSTRLRIPQIAVSFHIWLNNVSDQFPNDGVIPNLYTRDDVIKMVDKIKAMGYKLVYEDREADERVGQETLFIRNEFASKYSDLEIR